ncbi:RluA family pseudouridine synthase [uncultured Campylobacter sp.]|uniref:RluA family pseudouridine synthase n=1 Tax=uncultured Campylobacter sp. TaxID=218934 RepID=UPI00261986C9|nr:RluA family pseudouridine synthase [uncultured Campylobacter sp.]
MSYIKKELKLTNLKAFALLMKEFNISMREAQRLIDKRRLFCNDELVLKKNEFLQGKVELLCYENNPKGVDIVFENDDFAVLEKESGILSHPNGRKCSYSLCDEIWHLWGKQACVAHRLDKQTSGLILVAKHKKSQIEFKSMFEKKEIKKEYLALVYGYTNDEFVLDDSLSLNEDYEDVKTRVVLDKNGKKSISYFKKIDFFKDLNASFLLCKPLTGRQHQLRAHLFYNGHRILGDCLYGLEKDDIEKILDGLCDEKEYFRLCLAKRLCLHSNRLSFVYKEKKYDIFSKKDTKSEFLNSCKF